MRRLALLLAFAALIGANAGAMGVISASVQPDIRSGGIVIALFAED